MKRTVNFLDADRNLVTAECEITQRNGYPEFTMSGEYTNGLGQVFDEVRPANTPQKALINLWRKYHLNGMLSKENIGLPEDFEITLNNVIREIEELEEERKGMPLSELTDEELLKLINESGNFFDRDLELCAAFVRMFDLCENDLEDIEINDTYCTVQGIDYLAGTDDEMDQAWDEELDNYLDECVLPDLPENMRFYFDSERWKGDAKIDGRGHALNRYDGSEEEYEINGTYYYAYRQ